jgi:signal transduction histidine kinase
MIKFANLNLSTKMVALVFLSTCLVASALGAFGVLEIKRLGEAEINRLHKQMLAEKKQSLKDYVDLALASVKEHYDNTTDVDQTKEQAKAILRTLAFGEDGYVFTYDWSGTVLAYPTKPQLEGKNLTDLKDKNGGYPIKALIDQAKQGSGYITYAWDKPSKGVAVDKLSYAAGLPNWQWMIGTGVYIDDIEDAVAEVQNQVDEDIRLFIPEPKIPQPRIPSQSSGIKSQSRKSVTVTSMHGRTPCPIMIVTILNGFNLRSVTWEISRSETS